MEVKPELEKAGVAVVALGTGTPSMAQSFAREFDFRAEIYVDPTRAAYRAFGLHRGLLRTVNPAALRRARAASAQGFGQGELGGDPWQQGATFVLGPGNVVRFAHRDLGAGDHADIRDVLAACW